MIIIIIINKNKNNNKRRTMTQAVSRRDHTAKDRFRSQSNSCELCGEYKNADRWFSKYCILLLV